MAKATVDHFGRELFVEKYGFSLSIPPGALQEASGPQDICIEVLTKPPEDLVMKEDELIVSFGFQCSPPGLYFKRPVKVTMPHCAILTDVGKVKGVVYTSIRNIPSTYIIVLRYTGWPPPPNKNKNKKHGQPMWTKFHQI